MLRLALPAVLVTAFMVGCSGVDYEAMGDQQSARGDHAAAYRSYQRVPAGVGTPDLPGKRARALEEALERLKRLSRPSRSQPSVMEDARRLSTGVVAAVPVATTPGSRS